MPKEERDYLGGWSAHGSDTYTRVAVRVISNLQRLVIKALVERPNADPLAEEETIIQFESLLCAKGVVLEDRARCFKHLGKVSISMPVERTPELAVEELGPMVASESIPDEEQLAETIPEAPKADRRFKSESSRTQALGGNPKKFEIVPDVHWRQDITCQHPVENPTKILHFLGDCYMTPGIDYFGYQDMGLLMP